MVAWIATERVLKNSIVGCCQAIFQYAFLKHPTKLFYGWWDLKGEINVLCG